MNINKIFRTIYQFASAIVVSTLLFGCGGDEPTGTASPPPAQTYTVSGKVTFATGGSDASTTQLALQNNISGEALFGQPDASGNYTIVKVPNGNYTLSITGIQGSTFNPSSISVPVSGSNVSSQNFTEKPPVAVTYSISGTISGAKASGVTVALSGKSSGSKTTGTDGKYTFSGLTPGNYTVKPTLTNYTFDKTETMVTVQDKDMPGIDFISTAVVVQTYTISGTVTGATGVTISMTGAATKTATSTGTPDSTYSFTAMANGSYTLTPVKSGFTFSPSSASAIVNNGNVVVAAFTATANTVQTYKIDGTVTGAKINGVTITLTPGNSTTTTNATGNYSFSGLTNGAYTATPSLTGYSFAPLTATATITNANTTFANFVSTSTAPTFSVSGTVTGTGNSGVTMNLTGSATASTTTDATGNYTFSALANGTYTITPDKTGFTFTPGTQTVTVNNANIPAGTGTNFVISTAAGTGTLTGTVTGPGLSNVSIALRVTGSNRTIATTTTDTTGNYSFTGLANNAYTATPTRTGYTFTPASVSATITATNQTLTLANMISAAVATGNRTISGTVVDSAGGAGIANIAMRLTGATTQAVRTDVDGNYTFSALASGNYTVTPSSNNYTFSPQSLDVAVGTNNVNGQDFTGTASANNAAPAGTVTIGGTTSSTDSNE